MSDGGKGDKPRPIPDRKGYEQRFDAIDWNARERDEQQGCDVASGDKAPVESA